ncbi:MAG: pseudouridine synthase [Flavisolibacter sp.]
MKKATGFEKFMSKEKKGAAKKEQFRQEKRKWKKEQQEKKQSRFKNDDRQAPINSRVNKDDKQGSTTSRFRKDDRQAPTKNRFNADDRRAPSKTRFEADDRQAPAKKRFNTDDRQAPVKSSFKKDRPSQPSRSISIQKKGADKTDKAVAKNETPASTEAMPLNKYISHGGLCSRRDAAELIKQGKVKVNGALVTEPGFKVSAADEVKVAGKKVTPVRNLVYILLNKPKDYITTTDDPQQRKTVLDLVRRATPERVYPVGRLDRNTSGVLLLTNDGELSQKLTHPSNEIKKLYAVTLDKPLTKAHFEAILQGVSLEDGMAHVDTLAFTDAKDHTQLGIELHSGKNRIVRRIFEHFGYDVRGLDRVLFAGLTKKNVPRGKWRFLNEKEIRDLKFFKKGKK